MPNTAPGTQHLAGGVEEDAAPAAAARPSRRLRRWAGPAVFVLVLVVLFGAFLRLSRTYPENSDEANILLMANDMLHGNVLLHGWSVSDVPFITTELPQIALLVWVFGLHLNTAHIAAALTYTLIAAVGMLLAKGRARGWTAVGRMAIALAIMLAPQPGVGIFVVIFSVGHIGTALPVLLTWLVLDRLGRKWYVPPLVAVLLGWALTADPLVLVVAVFPLLAVCLARVVSALALGAKEGGVGGLHAAAADRWFEMWLAAAAGIGYTIAWGAGQFISNSGGYFQQAVPYALDPVRTWFWHAQVVVHGLLEMFGAYFVSGSARSVSDQKNLIYPLSGFDQAIALTRLLAVVLAVWGACAIARRFFFRDADFVSQLLLAGIVANIAAYVPSTLADATALNAREIAPVLPFAAVLAGRMLGDRLVTGPLVRVRLPGAALPGRAERAAPDGRPGGAAAAARPAGASALPGEASALPGGAAGPAAMAAPRQHGRRRSGTGAGMLRIPVAAALFAVLFGWYGYGLFRQADTPAAPNPLTRVAAFLKANHLRYGLGGYWEASVLTVETGGAVTVRAVTPACLQPYKWESKQEWYDPGKHVANFILLSNVEGYFSKFAASGNALSLLDTWSRPPYDNAPVPAPYARRTGSTLWPAHLNTGGWYLKQVPLLRNGHPVVRNGHTVLITAKIWYYTARVYPMNLLDLQPRLAAKLNSPPAVVCG